MFSSRFLVAEGDFSTGRRLVDHLAVLLGSRERPKCTGERWVFLECGPLATAEHVKDVDNILLKLEPAVVQHVPRELASGLAAPVAKGDPVTVFARSGRRLGARHSGGDGGGAAAGFSRGDGGGECRHAL